MRHLLTSEDQKERSILCQMSSPRGRANDDLGRNQKTTERKVVTVVSFIARNRKKHSISLTDSRLVMASKPVVFCADWSKEVRRRIAISGGIVLCCYEENHHVRFMVVTR